MIESLLSFADFNALSEDARQTYPTQLALRLISFRHFPSGKSIAYYRDTDSGRTFTVYTAEVVAMAEDLHNAFPATMMLRRIAIRQFPDAQLVALYKDQATGRLIPIQQ